MTAAPKPAANEPRIPADRDRRGPLPSDVGPPAKTVSVALVAGFGVLAACLLIFGTIAQDVRRQEYLLLDQTLNPTLHALASPVLDVVMNGITTLGSNLVLPPVFVVAILSLLRSDRRGAASFLTVAAVGSLLLNALMKLFFERPRPQLPWAAVLPDYSFPSGHTMNSFAVYLALAVILWSIFGRRAGVVAVAAALVLGTLIGVSRVYLGYHYFSDVLGGALAGTSWLLIVLGAFRSPPLARFWSRPRQQPGRPGGHAPAAPRPRPSAPTPGPTDPRP